MEREIPFPTKCYSSQASESLSGLLNVCLICPYEKKYYACVFVPGISHCNQIASSEDYASGGSIARSTAILWRDKT